MDEFQGFPGQCLPFLTQLNANNHREWFNQRKAAYETLIREPALTFISDVAPLLGKISPHFDAIAKKSGGSLMRVYRDTRYSKDKTPYKTNIGIQFRHRFGKDVHAPGFYLHIEPGNCFIGAGIWRPDATAVSKIRDFLVDNPAAWRKAKAHPPFRKHFVLTGESLQRPPRGYPREHELSEDLKRKDFIACRAFDDEAIGDRALLQLVIGGFQQSDPFMRYLCTALELPY
ncbi:MAG: DUF2461 domain-containing protein [Chromatiaceae bacterium]|nr:DUF2461 domain-containing protein [Chromatiaceae bacterium]